VVVAIVIVVTHLGFLVAVTLTLNGLFGNLHFLPDGRTWDRCVNGELVGVDLRTELGCRSGVGRGAVGAETLAVVTLSDVNGAQVGTTVVVDFNVSLGVLGSSRLRAEMVLFAVVLLVLETGTAATFFFTCNKNLFLAVTVLCTGRNLSSVGSERRVSLFPSGWLLLGKFDVNLLVSGGCGGGGLCFAVPISGREDAEGNGDSGLKVQIDDFCCRERIFSYNLP
jgi:hypothetical protein